jgi:hypothetical protein
MICLLRRPAKSEQSRANSYALMSVYEFRSNCWWCAPPARVCSRQNRDHGNVTVGEGCRRFGFAEVFERGRLKHTRSSAPAFVILIASSQYVGNDVCGILPGRERTG